MVPGLSAERGLEDIVKTENYVTVSTTLWAFGTICTMYGWCMDLDLVIMQCNVLSFAGEFSQEKNIQVLLSLLSISFQLFIKQKSKQFTKCPPVTEPPIIYQSVQCAGILSVSTLNRQESSKSQSLNSRYFSRDWRPCTSTVSQQSINSFSNSRPVWCETTK